MGATKTTHFSKEQNEVAMLMKAMGHPARVAILEYLLKTEGCICTDIVKELPLAQPTISQHLKELKNAQIIQGSVEGTAICYCINEATLTKIQGYFMKVFEQIKDKKCC